MRSSSDGPSDVRHHRSAECTGGAGATRATGPTTHATRIPAHRRPTEGEHIVAGNQAARAARNATRTMVVVNDPVTIGLVASLARPGGNVTGTSLLSSTLAGKRLELLKQVLPHVSRVAVLLNKEFPLAINLHSF